jgi:hypothetical protein
VSRPLTAAIGSAMVLLSLAAVPITAPADSSAAVKSVPPNAPRDGQHDFDFSIGTWRTHISRRVHPLSGSNVWADYVGTSVVRKLWDGRGSLGETEADGSAGHLEAMSLRLYNPEARQWSLRYASAGGTTSTPTALTVPTVGEFKNGRGEFFDTELFNGKSVLVRNVWSDISASSIRFEQAFSEDGGRTWEVNWVAVDTRVDEQPAASAQPVRMLEKEKTEAHDNQHDFDFEFGAWKVHLRRLRHPLSGSNEWLDYDGISTLSKVWDGRANIGELEVDGAGSHLEGLSLRLYDSKAHTWSIYWANSRDGDVGTPMMGRFANGRGEFYDQDSLDGVPIFVRFVFSDVGPASFHFEQSFSADGGKSWEANWIADFTRIRQ